MNQFFSEDQEWKFILQKLSEIRTRGEYSAEEVDFIRQQLQALDDRVRGGAALAAEGCLFEPQIIDLLLDLAENDTSVGVRKAALQSLQDVVREAVEQGLENPAGASGDFDQLEEWTELQEGSFREHFERLKYILFTIMNDDRSDLALQQMALAALAYLGHLPEVQEWIRRFFRDEQQSSRLVALHAMGKFPQYWEEELSSMLEPDTPKALLMEAVSSCFSSHSQHLARKLEALLDHPDPEVLSYVLMTLANMNQTENLGDILQRFSLHEDSRVQEAARKAIDIFTQKNFDRFLNQYYPGSEE
ncbi:MAG: HEAT repeat domain-containing protein [Calditrichaeota bacterium]|nr:MAG: HEAT repeat domain-containing protein [Calditrichota bacterium]